MNVMMQIYHGFVYSILFVLAGVTIVGCTLLFCRKVARMCHVVLRTVPKSSLLVLLLISTVATIHAQKRKVYVDSSVEISGDGSMESPYKEIDDVLGEIASSTSRLGVVIAPGVYGPLCFSEVPLDANGDPLSISITTYQRDGEEDENPQWVIDGNGNDYAVYSPFCEATTNIIRGVAVKNAVRGIGNFRVKGCVVSDCDEAALVGCHVESSEISNSGIGLDGGYASSCSFTGCTNIVLKDAIAEFCHVTNNAAIGVLNGTIDTCLVDGNDYGATNATIFASSILSNRRGGVLGESRVYNSLIAYNMDGNGRLCNFNVDTVTMTNCCTAPLPIHGADNFYSAMPIYPGTYKLPIGSPVFRNGSTNFLNFTKDLYGMNRRKNGVTDIGAFVYTSSPDENILVPKSWYGDKYREFIEKLIKDTPLEKQYSWRAWTDTDNYKGTILQSTVLFTNEELPFDAYYYGNHPTYYFFYSSIINTESSKKKQDGTPLKWWEEYILGTNPLDSNDVFRVSIEMGADGVPLLTWKPDLGDDRVYLLFGKKELSDEWVYIYDGNLAPYRFFKVAVDLP